MWKTRILVLFSCMTVAACATPRFNLDEEARTSLSRMPGQIELKFVSDKIRNYKIANGELSLETMEEYQRGWDKGHPYIRFDDEAPQGLPVIQGSEYHGPYRLSPDNSVLFLSIGRPGGGTVPTDFVLIQMENREVLFQRRSRKKYYVEDVAWSEDSSMFAVLDKSSRWSLGIPGILYYVLAHPTDVGKFYLSIYDRNGNLLVNTKVASGLLGGSGRMSWRNK